MKRSWLERSWSDKVSIFVSVKAASAASRPGDAARWRGAVRRGALREESRATMHADPYSGRCYFRSILSIEEGRRTAARGERDYVTAPCF